jgi:hypothetical protein
MKLVHVTSDFFLFENPNCTNLEDHVNLLLIPFERNYMPVKSNDFTVLDFGYLVDISMALGLKFLLKPFTNNILWHVIDF